MMGLSERLFWNTDRREVATDSYARWLAKRVLEVGEWLDWQVLVQT